VSHSFVPIKLIFFQQISILVDSFLTLSLLSMPKPLIFWHALAHQNLRGALGHSMSTQPKKKKKIKFFTPPSLI